MNTLVLSLVNYGNGIVMIAIFAGVCAGLVGIVLMLMNSDKKKKKKKEE